MQDAIKALQPILEEWCSTGVVEEVHWRKMRSLDFQETLRSRDTLAKQLENAACMLCQDFEDHVSGGTGLPLRRQLTSLFKYLIVHGEKFLQERIENLKQAISEQNMELIPDYEQRVAVLKELKFVDDNSTVLLKGRVACEVSVQP